MFSKLNKVEQPEVKKGLDQISKLFTFSKSYSSLENQPIGEEHRSKSD